VTQVSDPERLIVAFAHRLRAAGLLVPVGAVTVFTEALGLVGLVTRPGVYWAGRATLVNRLEDLAVYDQVFASFWDGAGAQRWVTVVQPVTVGVDEEDPGEDEPGGPSAEEDAADGDVDRAVRYSRAEILAGRDFSELTAEEWAEANRLIARLGVGAELRRTRRMRPVHAGRGYMDLRSTVARSMKTGGVPVARSWRTRTWRPRRLVLVIDVSGSMEPYARALLRFAHAATRSRRTGAAGGRGQVETFALGTRLSRITPEMTGSDPDAALAAASRRVLDWSGGTRLGDGLAELNDRWGALTRGAVVVVLSDGWDRGDPARLGAEMARLHRVARRVVWANPLKASPGYLPVARGMAAALPWVDNFVEGHTLASLEGLAALVAGPGDHRTNHTVRETLQ
jgi:uncharacterized protein